MGDARSPGGSSKVAIYKLRDQGARVLHQGPGKNELMRELTWKSGIGDLIADKIREQEAATRKLKWSPRGSLPIKFPNNQSSFYDVVVLMLSNLLISDM